MDQPTWRRRRRLHPVRRFSITVNSRELYSTERTRRYALALWAKSDPFNVLIRANYSIQKPHLLPDDLTIFFPRDSVWIDAAPFGLGD
jgi:hypothetical protein